MMDTITKIFNRNTKIFLTFFFGALIIIYNRNFIKVDFFSHKIIQNDTSNLKNTKFVSVCNVTFNSRRTGNMLFVFTALLYVSKHTCRKPIMPISLPDSWIDHIFVNDFPRFPNGFIYDPYNSVVVNESRPGLVYDEQFRNNLLKKTLEDVKTILICGYFHSYKYVVEVEEELRNYLRFKNDILRSVDEFMMKETETVYTPFISYIGVHVRRTDFVTSASLKNGRIAADENYLNSAMGYVIESLGSTRSFVAFMCSDDIDWVKQAVQKLNFSARYPYLRIVYSVGHNSAFDLCLLSKCNASILSTGSYTWWAGWLANANITTYYSLFPKPKSVYGTYFIPRNYYPSTWRGIPDLETSSFHNY